MGNRDRPPIAYKISASFGNRQTNAVPEHSVNSALAIAFASPASSLT
jgi:hypothetical protein